MSLRPLLFISVLAALSLVACSDDDATPGADGGARADTGAGGADGGPFAGSCVQPGATGNSMGIGRYCTPGGNECAGSAAALCIADVRPSEGQAFCVVPAICNASTDCGSDAVCAGRTSEESTCVPVRCVPDGGMIFRADGGGPTSDAGVPTDASADIDAHSNG